MEERDIWEIRRPHPNLMKVYFLKALAANVLFPIVIWPLYFRYHTLRYKFDEEGVSAAWGILFRREVYLTYKRIQDIHVRRNILERWLGIGTVDVQTASGSSSAELSVEGLVDYEGVRDFLYRRMRGHGAAEPEAPGAEKEPLQDAQAQLVALLRGVQAELEGARRALERA